MTEHKAASEPGFTAAKAEDSNKDEEHSTIEGVLERVAEKDPEAAEQISHFIEVQQFTHKGPMPSPHDLALYSKTLENLPDRMMTMAEISQSSKAAHHQRILELKAEEIDVQRFEVQQADDAHKREILVQTIGMCFAFITVLVCVVGAFYLALQDKTEVALVIGGTTVVGIVAAFLKAKSNKE